MLEFIGKNKRRIKELEVQASELQEKLSEFGQKMFDTTECYNNMKDSLSTKELLVQTMSLTIRQHERTINDQLNESLSLDRSRRKEMNSWFEKLEEKRVLIHSLSSEIKFLKDRNEGALDEVSCLEADNSILSKKISKIEKQNSKLLKKLES